MLVNDSARRPPPQVLPAGDSDLRRAAEGAAERAVGAYCADLDDDAGELLGAPGATAGGAAWRAAWGPAVRRGLLEMGSTLAGLFPPGTDWDGDVDGDELDELPP